MILSGSTIRELVGIEPFSERAQLHGMSYGLGPAGYDVRLRQALDLEPGGFFLGSIIEHLTMPRDVIAFVHDKSTLARLGLALQNTVIEPGWRGYLTVEISNHGKERVRLCAGSPIAQLIFHRTDVPCVGYSGKYQDQGVMPVGAKWG
jgi:dCTP deaminase